MGISNDIEKIILSELTEDEQIIYNLDENKKKVENFKKKIIEKQAQIFVSSFTHTFGRFFTGIGLSDIRCREILEETRRKILNSIS